MDPLPPISADALIAQLRERFEQLCRGVADAVNAAPVGQVIRQSEEPVRDLLTDFRKEVFQAALQLQIDAAEAAFSPSGPDHRPSTRQ
jgi:hypothetical protein